MPIKQIQLRGISRTPSDRSVADGGCAESLNVHLDQQETAPTLPPVDYSDTAYGASVAAANRHRIVFIHKMPGGVTNYIGYKKITGNSPFVGFYAYGSKLSDGWDPLLEANGSSETFKCATSIGNMLIIYTNASAYYYLFGGTSYKSLASGMSVPQIEIAALPNDPRYAEAEVLDETLKAVTDSPWNVWNGATESTSELYGGLLAAMNGLWESIVVEMKKIRSEGKFVAPFFIRYALKLYDGTYIHSSAPVLCGGFPRKNSSFSVDWLTANLTTEGTGSDQVYKLSATFNNPFTVYIRCGATGAWDNLTSIVESIDFFASTPIYAPAMYAGYQTMDSDYSITLDKMDGASRDSTILDEVLSKGQFYKILSVPINDSVQMGQLADGTFVLLNSDTVSGDLLLVQDTMPETYRDGSTYIPLVGAKNFNNRNLLIGAIETFSRGNFHLNGQAADRTWASTKPGMSDYYLRFKIEDPATGEVHYVGMRSDNDDVQNACFCATESNGGGTISLRPGSSVPTQSSYNKCTPYAWLAYPDTRCTEVEIRRPGSSSAFKIAMKPHPMLECSYAFFGFGVSYNSITSSDTTDYSTSESRTMPVDNKVFLSEMENPYVYPAGNIVTFPDRVVDLAAISVPLSQGQFGEHTMYVFTEGGIRVLGVNAEGTFSAQAVHPHLGRYVALPETVLGIEQAVVFTTEKGVMLLSGNQVTELSASINGAPFILNGETGSALSDIKTALGSSAWSGLLPTTRDTATFMSFMKSATPAYDYNGSRFIFFNSSKNFQYVYMLGTQTWHKYDNGIYDTIILNSFPDCLISIDPHRAPNPPQVLDYSTVLDDTTMFANAPSSGSDSVQPIKGIIATRPFDLGEPDVRKTIRSIRIRGNYNRADVQYLLLGSFDGINWHWMKSLRGGSYKMFRLILLTNLMPKERITWIDVDYETRFTNRLR